ncbi:LacI family transcriptional regulator [Zobellella endophytica]|uniref:LacI family transcriptional regulator n=1 Tax=Zobellella endophytica TaxID=2116700 RepID=A0A2P7RBJ5_9GAMM|nr:substrate-binding domain-containing protein [Zobellella endophytica]PSJ47532.1 LacI family transcriptional regulator [Zobellella endophytica]
MVTLKDLAEHLGLSQATVSRALNGYPEVNEKTRRRVLEASRQLNYLPNLGARKLATGKSGMVGIVLKSSDELVNAPEYVQMIAEISRHLGDAGYDLLINSARQGNALDSFKRFVAGRAVDGLILNSPELEDERVAFLQEQGFPFVMHGRSASRVDYPYYDIDNYDAMTQATELLLALGHQRIALLNGPAHLAFATERARAFHDRLQQQDLTVPVGWMTHQETSDEAGYQQARSWLEAPSQPMPSAIICASATQALGVYRAAGELDIAIGRELSVIAHDDVVSFLRTDHFDPPLTVTRSPFMDACRPLAEMMVALLDGADPQPLQTVASVELIVRRSCGPCPRA